MNGNAIASRSNRETLWNRPAPLSGRVTTEPKMAVYEQKLHQDLQHIRQGVMEMGEGVQVALTLVLGALFSGNEMLANQVILKDYLIDRQCRELDRLCRVFMVKHSPIATHLRLVSATMRMIYELERIADYAVNIARKLIDLPHPVSGWLQEQMQTMANDAQTMLRQALTAYAQESVALACATLQMNARLGKGLDEAMRALVQEGDAHKGQTRVVMDVQVIFSMLERVGNRATNLCEEIVYWLTGKSIRLDLPRILFLDDENNSLSLMAEAIAKKVYTQQCLFFSAGRAPTESMHPLVGQYMHSMGFDCANLRPKSLEVVDWHAMDIIIGLQDRVRSYIETPPFHTVCLHWDVGVAPHARDRSTASRCIDESYRELSLQLRTLMEIVTG